MDDPLDDWFTREILAHEEMLMRFLARVWPRRDELADIRQESYARVYEASRGSRPLHPKAFLFATARHLMADRIRRGRIVSIQAAGDSDYLNVLIDELTPEHRISAAQELAKLARAYDRLPARCREVFWLRRIKELPQKEVAARLGVTEKAIEKHIANAMRLLAQHMLANSITIQKSRAARNSTNADETIDEHGAH